MRDLQIIQSTHPVWDATIVFENPTKDPKEFQSTHPVWDATRSRSGTGFRSLISIHASRMGCDISAIFQVAHQRFQSTHPVWDATVPVWSVVDRCQTISIHASRMGCDYRTLPPRQQTRPISIHASRMGCDQCAKFLPVFTRISIHASRMGCDCLRALYPSPQASYFNPRIPYGMRRQSSVFFPYQTFYFNPRIPYGMRRE